MIDCPQGNYLKLALAAALLGLVGCGDRGAVAAPEQGDAPVAETRVRTNEGPVTGFVTSNGVRAWLGVPFAKPPVGELRWRAPKPPVRRDKPLTATHFSSACAQIATPLGGAPDDLEEGSVWGSEDCLYLNIYAPKNLTNAPVMLWIHGGGNFVGHSSFYDGSTLAKAHNLVVVTINYRLGPLGWLHHASLAGSGKADRSGNYGTLDIIRALTWVRDNIAAFGGQRDRITVFGESAGATNVASLVASPLAKGLFQGAIMQSGNVIATTSLNDASALPDAKHNPGASLSSSEVLLRAVMKSRPSCDRACAKTRLASMSLSKQAALLRGQSTADIFALYGERVYEQPRLFTDGYVLPRGGMLSAFSRRDHVPMIIGSNKDETKLFMAFNPEYTWQVAGLPVRVREPERYDMVAKYGTMVWKHYGVDAPAARLAKAGAPIWTYRFDWDDLAGMPMVDYSSMLGAAHAFEIPFVFGNFWLGSQTRLLFDDGNKAEREALAERMMAYWAAFAYSGNPGKGRDGKGPVWPVYAPDAGVGYLVLDGGEDGIRLTADERALTISSILRKFAKETEGLASEEKCGIAKEAFSLTPPEHVYSEMMAELGCTPSVAALR